VLSVETKTAIIDLLGHAKWRGDLSDAEFLSRLYPLSDMKSDDRRCSNALQDIKIHCERFRGDWSDDWIWTDVRFELHLESRFLRFIVECIHPKVMHNSEDRQRTTKKLSELLCRDGFILKEIDFSDGAPVFQVVRATEKRIPSFPGSKMRYNSEIKVFFSHSSKDEAVIDALVRVVRSSVDIKASEIRCTSVSPYKISAGAVTEDILRDDIKSCSVLVAYLSRNSISSPYVLMELGAAWVEGKCCVLILSQDLDFDQIPGPIKFHSLRVGDDMVNRQLLAEVVDAVVNESDLKRISNVGDHEEAISRFQEAASIPF